MNEAKLRHELANSLRRSFTSAVVFCHEDKFTAGIPDLSITLDGVTLWFELKHVTPKKRFKTTDLQVQTAVELENCWYIVYEERKIMKTEILSHMTYIINPQRCRDYREGLAGDGLAHWFVVEFVRDIYAKRRT